LHAIGSAYFEKGEYTLAKAWSLRSALKDNSNAQTALGLLYHDGLGHPIDFKQALYWYTKAASLGHRAAQRNIGVLFEEGKGVEINRQQALEWYTRSADQGLEEAIDKVQEFHNQGVFLNVGQISK
jgi:TPR repeat protein